MSKCCIILFFVFSLSAAFDKCFLKENVLASVTTRSSQSASNHNLLSYGITQSVSVVITDLKHDSSVVINDEHFQASAQRKKRHTCYTCMCKFATLEDLEVHKYIHSESEVEDDFYDENYSLPDTYTNVGEISDVQGNVEDISDVQVNVEETEKIDDEVVNIANELNITLESGNTEIIYNAKDLGATKDIEDANTKETRPHFKCFTCRTFFKNIDEFKAHNLTKSCKFYCVDCHGQFRSPKRFSNHIYLHTSQTNPIPVFQCKICAFKFLTSYRLQRHERRVHEKNKTVSINKTNKDKPKQRKNVTENLTCELCYDVFNTKKELKEHMAFHKELEKGNKLQNDDTEAANEIEIIDESKNKHEITATLQAVNVSPDAKYTSLTQSTTKCTKKIKVHENLASLPIKVNTLVKEDSLEVKKTGPYSFAVNYKVLLPRLTHSKPNPKPIINEPILQQPVTNNLNYLKPLPSIIYTNPLPTVTYVELNQPKPNPIPTGKICSKNIKKQSSLLNSINLEDRQETQMLVVHSKMETIDISNANKNDLNAFPGKLKTNITSKKSEIHQDLLNSGDSNRLHKKKIKHKTTKNKQKINYLSKLLNFKQKQKSKKALGSTSNQINFKSIPYKQNTKVVSRKSKGKCSQIQVAKPIEEDSSSNLQTADPNLNIVYSKLNHWAQLSVPPIQVLDEQPPSLDLNPNVLSLSEFEYLKNNPPEICIVSPVKPPEPIPDSSIAANVSTNLNLIPTPLDQTTFVNFNEAALLGGLVTASPNLSIIGGSLNDTLVESNSRTQTKPQGQTIIKKQSLKYLGNCSEEPIVIDSDEEDDEEKLCIIENASLYCNESLSVPKKNNKIKEQNIALKKEFIATCDTCKEVFYENIDIVRHSTKRLICKECNQLFCKLISLKKHYLDVHKKVYCSECKFVAGNIEDYYEHTKKGKCSNHADI